MEEQKTNVSETCLQLCGCEPGGSSSLHGWRGGGTRGARRGARGGLGDGQTGSRPRFPACGVPGSAPTSALPQQCLRAGPGGGPPRGGARGRHVHPHPGSVPPLETSGSGQRPALVSAECKLKRQDSRFSGLLCGVRGQYLQTTGHSKHQCMLSVKHEGDGV